MRCEEIRERFPEMVEPPEHIKSCSECRAEWELQLLLREFKAPALDDRFNARVLAALDHRAPLTPGIWENVASLMFRVLPPLAVALCLLLFLWMGRLAATRPGPELRALDPIQARAWSNLPDAVPPPALPGPAPDRRKMRLVKGDDR